MSTPKDLLKINKTVIPYWFILRNNMKYFNFIYTMVLCSTIFMEKKKLGSWHE